MIERFRHCNIGDEVWIIGEIGRFGGFGNCLELQKVYELGTGKYLGDYLWLDSDGIYDKLNKIWFRDRIVVKCRVTRDKIDYYGYKYRLCPISDYVFIHQIEYNGIQLYFEYDDKEKFVVNTLNSNYEMVDECNYTYIIYDGMDKKLLYRTVDELTLFLYNKLVNNSELE